MAGEWIPIDVTLASKPEILELMDETDEPVEAVVFRIIRLWSWAAMNTADGTLRATPRRLSLVAGGDEDFWLAVERVGWISFGDGTVTIAGWEKRFSGAAKARAMHARRQDSYRKKGEKPREKVGCDASVTADRHASASPCGALRDTAPSPEERRGEDIREEITTAAQSPMTETQKRVRSPASAKISWDSSEGWSGITDADRSDWREAYPAADIPRELAKATAWLKANPSRAGRRNWRRFLVNWLAKCQEHGGTDRKAGNRPDERPPPERWLDQYKPADYRRPREAAALAAACKVPEE